MVRLGYRDVRVNHYKSASQRRDRYQSCEQRGAPTSASCQGSECRKYLCRDRLIGAAAVRRDHTMKLSQHLTAISLVQRPAHVAEEVLGKFLAKYGEVERVELAGWAEVAAYLSPLLSFGTRHVLVPHGEWTLIIDNMHGGSPGDLGVVLSTRSGAVVVNATWREDGRIWEVIDKGERQRAVACYEDGGRWVFHEEGTPFGFEDTAAFAKRKKSERFPVSAVQHNVGAMTGVEFPMDWRAVLSAPAVGLERSTSQFKNPVKQFPTEIDLF